MSFGDQLTFLKQFLRSPTAIGAIWPSSQALAQTMVDWLDWTDATAVVEYGPGTGIFTEAIQPRLRPDAKFFAIEANSDLVAMLHARLPDVRVYHDSVSRVGQLCEREGIDQLDAIVCGLPWASFSDSLQTELLDATGHVLREGGQFVTFAYLQGLLLPAGQRFKRKLRDHFGQVETSRTVWANMPPAFVYRCRK